MNQFFILIILRSLHAPSLVIHFLHPFFHICITFITLLWHQLYTFFAHLLNLCYTIIKHLSHPLLHICNTFVTHLWHPFYAFVTPLVTPSLHCCNSYYYNFDAFLFCGILSGIVLWHFVRVWFVAFCPGLLLTNKQSYTLPNCYLIYTVTYTLTYTLSYTLTYTQNDTLTYCLTYILPIVFTIS